MKIWTVTYNDDDGVRTDVFNSAEAADKACTAWCGLYWDEWVQEKYGDFPEHWSQAFEKLCETCGFLDSITVDVHDVHPPETTGLDAIIAAAVHTNDELEVDGNAVISMGEDPGAFVSSWSWVNFADVEQPMAIIEDSSTVWYFDCFDQFMEAWSEEPNCNWVKGTDELLEKSDGPNDSWEYLTRHGK